MTSPVDILLYVALSEEFDTVLADLGDGFRPEEMLDAALTIYRGAIEAPSSGRSVSVAVIPAGKMGNSRAASISAVVIEKLRPANVVVLGIAGSLSDDLNPGDVFIPDAVNEYLANSASQGEEERWTLRTSGNRYSITPRLMNRAQQFRHTDKESYASWLRATERFRAELISQDVEDKLETLLGASGRDCRLRAGDDRILASGPTVGKGKAFLTWLKSDVDRKISALEMESAGVLDASSIRTQTPRVLIIRGISDHADERKEEIEKIAKGRFRKLSVKNALSFFVHAVSAGLFKPEADAAPTGPQFPPREQLDARVRSVFVIGGKTGETDDRDGEVPLLNHVSINLGRALAKADAHLLICSPFTDSADYYVARGYAESRSEGGTIQFHSPEHPDVKMKREQLQQTLGWPAERLQVYNYPGPESTDEAAWHQAWLLAQIQALEKADVVVAIGGEVSKTANTLLHLAEARGLPVVPFSFLGGAAQRLFSRRDWKGLNPGFDASILTREDGVRCVVEIINRLAMDRIRQLSGDETRPEKVFISVAQQNNAMGDAIAEALKERGIEAVRGDHEIRSDQMVSVSIEQALLRSDTCAILWSRHYAQSPWCYDELAMALDRQAYRGMKVWLFNLDGSPVVPAQARKLPSIAATTPTAINAAVAELLTSYSKDA